MHLHHVVMGFSFMQWKANLFHMEYDYQFFFNMFSLALLFGI